MKNKLVLLAALNIASTSILAQITSISKSDVERIRKDLKGFCVITDDEDHTDLLRIINAHSSSLFIVKYYYLAQENWSVFNSIDDIRYFKKYFNIEWFYLKNPEKYDLEVNSSILN